MPIVAQSIPALYGGVSQQAAPIRAANQCEEAINAYFTLTRGASKRPALQLVNNLATLVQANPSGPSPFTDYFFHHVPYPHHEGFLLVIPGDGTYKVYRLSDGLAITMTGDTGQAYLTVAPGAKAREVFRASTVGLTTYIVNTSVVTALSATTAPGSIAGTAQTLQDNILDSAAEGSIYKILGDETNPYDTYYAKKEGGRFIEWVKPGEKVAFDVATMPHVLELTIDGADPLEADADFNPGVWEEMKVGDSKSNKPPSFVDKRLAGIFFAHDRLGFLCENKVSMSETGRYLNLWRTTVTDVLDTDRIDIAVSADGSSFLWHAKPLGKSIILFAEERNFSMDGNPIFSPRTVAVTQATAYPCSKVVSPQSSGPNVYFASNATDATSIREMFVQDDAVTNDAADITAHVPYYIEPGVDMMVANNDTDTILVGRSNGIGLACYNSYWAGDEKVQSAWNLWLPSTSLRILSMFSIGQHIYAVFYANTFSNKDRTSHLMLGKWDMRPTGFSPSFSLLGYVPHLDALSLAEPTYNAVEDRTYFTSPFPIMAFRSQARLVILTGVNAGKQYRLTNPGPVEVIDGPDHFTFALPGNWSGDLYAVGLQYEFRFTFSEQFLTGGERSSLTSRLQLRTMTVSFQDTVAFRTRVEVLGTPASEEQIVTSLLSTYTARTTGNADFMLSRPQLRSGSYRFPVLGRSTEAKITLINDEFTPCNFITAEWEALVSTRTRR